MGAYTNVKGWIEVPESLINDAHEIIKECIEQADKYIISEEAAKFYNQAWLIQQQSINGSQFIFYGATIKSHAVKFIKAQVIKIAKLKVCGEDVELYPDGLFYIDEDGTYGYPPEQWVIDLGNFIESERKI